MNIKTAFLNETLNKNETIYVQQFTEYKRKGDLMCYLCKLTSQVLSKASGSELSLR